MDHEKDEILIVLIPHIVRLPTITAENLRSIASGTDTNAEVRLEDAVLLPEPDKSRRRRGPPRCCLRTAAICACGSDLPARKTPRCGLSRQRCT